MSRPPPNIDMYPPHQDQIPPPTPSLPISNPLVRSEQALGTDAEQIESDEVKNKMAQKETQRRERIRLMMGKQMRRESPSGEREGLGSQYRQGTGIGMEKRGEEESRRGGGGGEFIPGLVSDYSEGRKRGKGEFRENQAAKAHKKKDDNKKSDDETKNDQLKQDRVAGRGRSEKGSWGGRSAGHTQTLDRE